MIKPMGVNPEKYAGEEWNVSKFIEKSPTLLTTPKKEFFIKIVKTSTALDLLITKSNLTHEEGGESSEASSPAPTVYKPLYIDNHVHIECVNISEQEKVHVPLVGKIIYPKELGIRLTPQEILRLENNLIYRRW